MSPMAMTTHNTQYVHPAKYPAHGPTRSWQKSWNDLYLRLWSSISPMARMTRYSTVPMMTYTSRMDGPARWMVWPEPMNKPVPMAPPSAIS